ncbi:2-C-methyl-D-erythritol 4-phosphate cytidylyltransferase [Halioglobus japonicus]|nr:2-C-methyl-D-erythritol 4-phosphate cytidylyltransferase [Halioglobus japonicus]
MSTAVSALQESRCWAVLPAAGTGSRMGAELPKQYMQLAGATLLEHSLQALLDCTRITSVVVALHPQDARARELAVFRDARVQTTVGGEQRSDSVLAGLDALSEQAAPQDWVLVHDAARPCLRSTDIEQLIESVIARDTGGILAEPIVDTVKQASVDALVERTLDRTTLWRAQTPQMFRIDELRRALREAQEQALVVTDEASAMELAGYPVQLVAGHAGNLKVTVPADLPLAAWYLQASSAGVSQ